MCMAQAIHLLCLRRVALINMPGKDTAAKDPKDAKEVKEEEKKETAPPEPMSPGNQAGLHCRILQPGTAKLKRTVHWASGPCILVVAKLLEGILFHACQGKWIESFEKNMMQVCSSLFAESCWFSTT